jgi:quinoprotein glucose dehydrogenase
MLFPTSTFTPGPHQRRLRWYLAVAAAAVAAATPITGQSGTGSEWRYYWGDNGSSKYSPLDQINKENVRNLQVAWRWKSQNFGPSADYNWEATPIMVGGVLYTTAGSRRDVVAIDAATGETLWMYRLEEGRRGSLAPLRGPSGRGVAYWSQGGEARILHVTAGYRLVALDPKTGIPVSTFGRNGSVDLWEGLERPVKEGEIGLTSPPTIVGNMIVVGAALQGLAPSKSFVTGYVRGFDVLTGKQVWTFRTIPRAGEFGNDTWENDAWSYSGNAGVWGGISADEALGYVYLGVESPTNDYYGGHRPGSGLFGETLVCLDARTGKRVWHYQLIHHGIWDYDIPTAPILVDIVVNGRSVKAVAQVTKQAHTYVFDRVTGEPVWPIIERPVPQSDVPGEKSSPTQPIPTRPAPFDRQGVTPDDLIDFTPELKAEALRIVSEYRIGPLYTPPSLVNADGTRGTITLPAGFGGTNWNGAAVDPQTGVLYIPSMTVARAIGIIKPDPRNNDMDYVGTFVGAFGGGRGASPDGGPQGLPIIRPPWGRVTAIDLNTGDHLWMVPNGDTPEYVRNHPALKGLNIPRTGQPGRAGLLVTRTLLFVTDGNGLYASAPGSGGRMLHVYDKQTGQTVWDVTLPSAGGAHPMTYMAGGKQFIVLAVGGQSEPGELVALTLM